ncbi:spore coat protein YutH [Bacillaceae bacterium IKA-2]|nr:spore coat protein YutH [Bacillaceae bacterium IKA-2]
MFERNVYDEYRLYSEQKFMLGEFAGFTVQNKHYFFVPIEEIENDEVLEMIKMGNHLQAQGDHEIATFIPTVNKTLTGFVDGKNGVLFQLPAYYSRSKKEKTLGFELARLHNSGKSYLTRKKEFANWTNFWINRSAQLDMLYENLAKQTRKSSFDQSFMTAFPYFQGRTENAIQYIVDANIDYKDDIQNQVKTICHYQFSAGTWLTIDNTTKATVKNPIEFVYDYPSRDLAERIREIVGETDDPFEKSRQFLNDYQIVEEISLLSWCHIYGRLLFPIDYFQIVEGYYRSRNADEREVYVDRFFELLSSEKKMETFLRQFHKRVISTYWQEIVPKVDWLSNRADRITLSENGDFLFKK